MARPVCILTVPIKGGGIYGAASVHPNRPLRWGEGIMARPVCILTVPIEGEGIYGAASVHPNRPLRWGRELWRGQCAS